VDCTDSVGGWRKKERMRACGIGKEEGEVRKDEQGGMRKKEGWRRMGKEKEGGGVGRGRRE